MTADMRRAVYALALAVIGALVAYGIIEAEDEETWITLATAIVGLAPLLALFNITPDDVVVMEKVIVPVDDLLGPTGPIEDHGPTI